jgi:hypothetical protein
VPARAPAAHRFAAVCSTHGASFGELDVTTPSLVSSRPRRIEGLEGVRGGVRRHASAWRWYSWRSTGERTLAGGLHSAWR